MDPDNSKSRNSVEESETPRVRERSVSSDSDSSTSSSSDSRRRRRRRRRRRGKKHGRLDRLEKVVRDLANKVGSIQNTNLAPGASRSAQIDSDSSALSIFAADDLEEVAPAAVPKAPSDTTVKFKLETTLKSSAAKTSSEHAEILDKLQHFNTPDWSQVRYADAQKAYVSFPGFTELESNDMAKSFDRNRALAVTEKTLAAITHALIMQNEFLQRGFDTFFAWLDSAADGLTIQDIKTKIDQTFSADYNKIHLDLLQMVCGRRADLIQQRRDYILSFVRDKCLKETLRKVPPTLEYLFDDKKFSDIVSKNGGMEKVFISPSRVSGQGGGYKRPLAQRVPNAEPKKNLVFSRSHVGSSSNSTNYPPAQGRKRKMEDNFRDRSRSDKFYKGRGGKRSQRRYD